MNAEFAAMLADFENEAKEDWIGLWQIVSRLRDCHPEWSASEVRRNTIEFVKLMLMDNFNAGDPPYSAHGYRRWQNQLFDYVIERIEREWDALGREPNIPDIVWFDRVTVN